MRLTHLVALIALSLACRHPGPARVAIAPEPAPMSYPESPRGDVADTLGDTTIPDPYRWLEDPDSDATRRWITEQNALTQRHLASIAKREAIRERLTELWNHERFASPTQRGDRVFFLRNDGLQDQWVLYVAEGEAPPRALLDPNTLSEDGTVSLASFHPSRDGSLVAWSVSDGGSDWRVWRVRDVATGEDLPDEVRWSKFSGASWLPDGSGFFYSAYDAPTDPLEQVVKHQKLYLHRLGTPQSDDVLVHARDDEPDWGFGAEVSDDGALLVIHNWEGTAKKNRIFLKDLTRDDAPVTPLLTAFDAQYLWLGATGRTAYFLTDKDAPRSRVIAVDLDAPDPARWVEIVPEQQETLDEVHLFGDVLVLHYLASARSMVRRVRLDGEVLGEVALPGLGTATAFDGSPRRPDGFFSFTSYTRPATLFRLDARTGETEVFRQPKVPFDGDDFVVEQAVATSRDGTQVPVFLVRHEDTPRDGDRPVLLYGYGGFNVPLTPAYKASYAVWLELGGVLAVANLRGGGEFGRDWYEAGTLHRKQNVFDDFIGAAEWLIEAGWTRPERLAIQGRSNGGLLVGAVSQQRPDLFGAALPGVGVMDMLRYHLFTIGWAWASDYGTADDPDMLPTLLAYSPVHNARPARYPATLVVTGDHDDRVVPAHSYKYTAAMQAAQQGPAPILIRIETRAGHGAMTPTSLQIAEATDEWAFLVQALGM